jgi:2-polyprenyl-3-methyl-5-hydroxy-6-metoxy-1,4-benzoquinol methylase
MKCQACNNKKNNFEIKNYKKIIKISSDERYSGTDCKIFVCKKCSLIQKIINKQYLKKLATIYKKYQAFPIKNGQENIINYKNKEYYRSDLILQKINNHKKLIGLDILDFGCGSGFTLNRISSLYPSNILYGFDYNFKNIKNLNKIKNFKKLYSQDILKINKKFDLIILNHVFEHLVNPNLYLKKIKNLLKKNGLIVLQMPNISKNFTDIFTFDHICYYDENTLQTLLNKINIFDYSFKICIPKEITCFLKIKKNKKKKDKIISKNKNINIEEKFSVIDTFSRKISNLKTNKNYIFGTTVPAIWCSKVLGNNKFTNFIEEDNKKINKKLNNKKIISIRKLKNNYNVIIPYTKKLKNKILNKISKNKIISLDL